MQQQKTFTQFFYKYIYLLIAAAWLITLSFIIDNYWSGNSSVEAVHKRLEKHIWQQETDFAKTVSDTSVVKKIQTKFYNDKLLESFINKKYFFYCYKIDETNNVNLVFWNSQVVLPTTSILNATDNIGFMQLPNGYYIWQKVKKENEIFIALIPIQWNYFVKNEYLQNTFSIGSGIEKQYEISESDGNIEVHSKAGISLFYLKKKVTKFVVENNTISIWFRLVASLLVLLFIHLLAIFIFKKSNLLKASVFLIGAIVFLRYLSYQLPIPLNLRQFELFDPSIYSTNAVLKSLGDLLINTILFGWVSLFIRYYLKEDNVKTISNKSLNKWIALSGYAALFLIITFVCGSVIRSMIADSQVSFDVINFFAIINIYSAVGFIVLCLIAISYFALSQVLVYLVKNFFPVSYVPLILSVVVIGLIYLTLKLNFATSFFELALLGWLIIYLFILVKINITYLAVRLNSSLLIFWLFFFSISITGLIVMENNNKELERRKHYAEALANKADPASETLMNTMLTDFRNKFLSANFSRFKNEEDNHFLKDSLINGNFSGYTNKYETKIYCFDSTEAPLFNADSLSINELNAVLNTQGKPTTIPDLYYYDLSYDRFSYMSKKIVTDTSNAVMGYIYILASPRRSKPQALYPELFSKGKNNSIENSSLYSFAIYNDLQLISNHNDYAFATKLAETEVPKNEFTLYNKKKYDELWYKAGPQKVVVIAKQDNLAIETITLFSYLFCIFLIIVGIFWVINYVLGKGWKSLKSIQFSIRNQIHGTVIFISVLSFLIIGVATILFFIRRYENNNRERLSRTIHVMQKEVKNSLNELAIFDDVVKIYDAEYINKIRQTIEKISEIHAADINLYDLEGNLKVSSLPLPYNKGVVSTKMNPLAYYHLNKLKEIQFFTEENIGKLNFVSNYVPVIDDSGREYAYLSIPYFTSESELKKEISNFLVTIINLNAFIFLIAGIIALFITNRITRSFSFISEKMKQVNIGKVNAAIDWNRNDEIGELVNEYNKMVSKLNESAAALAKSEREGAWREMARQVAHEIKNPLTPMKLSLQYLQKAISEKSGNVKELTESVANTLVEQIDHLSQIAGEFSQFANIGHTKKELFNVNEVLKLVIQLHSMSDNLEIKFYPFQDVININADKTQINRLFNNLILNAMQAAPEGQKSEITITELVNGNNVLIKIKDNGTGIPVEMQSKIFTPNFTTKTSGTGLGLAICKGIAEQSKGNIWFETKEGIGTTFFIELPMA